VEYVGIDWSYRRAAWCALSDAGAIVGDARRLGLPWRPPLRGAGGGRRAVSVAVRDLRTLEVIRSATLPVRPRRLDPATVRPLHCADADAEGAAVHVAVSDYIRGTRARSPDVDPGRRAPRRLRLGTAPRGRRRDRAGAIAEEQLRRRDPVALRAAPAVPHGRWSTPPTSGASAVTRSCACTGRHMWRADRAEATATGSARSTSKPGASGRSRPSPTAASSTSWGCPERPEIRPGTRRPKSLNGSTVISGTERRRGLSLRPLSLGGAHLHPDGAALGG
jgi:hypothetical protein